MKAGQIQWTSEAARIKNQPPTKGPNSGEVKATPRKRPEVKITGIEIPFFSLVWFLATVAIAAVPAGFIVFIFWSFLAAMFTGLLTGV